jgi:guanyl-specific ribonuclease Sa
MIAGKHWLRVAALVVFAVLAANGWLSRAPDSTAGVDDRPAPAEASSALGLPAEAHATLQLIRRGGPFAYDRDGTVFQNREGRLPAEPWGYYREYTVPTPGSRDRGARRIVTGGDPPGVYYYTDDHYRTFRRIEVPR